MSDVEPKNPKGRPKADERETLRINKFRNAVVNRMKQQKLSHDALAKNMHSEGFPRFTRSKATKFLTGVQSASLDECLAISRIVGVQIHDLALDDQSTDTLRTDASVAWKSLTEALDKMNELLITIATQRARFIADTSEILRRGDDAAIANDNDVPFLPENFSAWWDLEKLITDEFHHTFVAQNSTIYYDAIEAKKTREDEERRYQLFEAANGPDADLNASRRRRKIANDLTRIRELRAEIEAAAAAAGDIVR
jgi:hypothetical protein